MKRMGEKLIYTRGKGGHDHIKWGGQTSTLLCGQFEQK
jgi:hypothetical protein